MYYLFINKTLIIIILFKKNVAMSSQDIITIEDDFTLLRFQNDSDEVYCTQREVKSGLIQFNFGLKGKDK
mgnify:FL=1